MGAYERSSSSRWTERAFAKGEEVRDEADGGTYVVRRFIGRGGMGEVYEVERSDGQGRYALKCLQLEHVRNAKTIERTRREAVTLRDLRHPHVVRVHAAGVREDGLIWMIMDLLDGYTLAEVLRRIGKVPIPWALRIGMAVCAGLEAVHPVAVHRDLKPDNIHLGHDAIVRLLDLGAGKFHRHGLLTTGGATVGTVPYMAPEQLDGRGRGVDGRTDLFALGIVLAELISGVHPFAPEGLDHENVFTLVRKIIGDAPLSLKIVAPWAPDHVAAAVDRALVREPSHRVATAGEFGALLADALHRLEAEVGLGAPLAKLVAELRQTHGDEGPRTTDPLAPTLPHQPPPGGPDEVDTLVVDRAHRDA